MRMLPRAVQSDRSSHWGKQDVRVTELHEMVKTKCQAADRPVVACGKLCRSGERGFLPTSRAISGFDVLDEIEIIRLDVERYRRMLQIEVDETARQAIQKILMEFEAKLVSHKRRAVDPSQY